MRRIKNIGYLDVFTWNSSNSANYYRGYVITNTGEPLKGSGFYVDNNVGPFCQHSTIRPILTLKSTIEIAGGDGKNTDNAYQLS